MTDLSPNEDPVFHRDVTRHYPLVDRAEGPYVWDTAGRRYLDGAGGIFVVNIGHGVGEIADAVAEQMRRAAFAHTGFFTSEPEQSLPPNSWRWRPRDCARPGSSPRARPQTRPR